MPFLSSLLPRLTLWRKVAVFCRQHKDFFSKLSVGKVLGKNENQIQTCDMLFLLRYFTPGGRHPDKASYHLLPGTFCSSLALEEVAL